MADKGEVSYHKRIDFRALDVFVDAVSSATKDELRQAVKTASEKSKDYGTYAYDRQIWKRLATLLRSELKGYAKNPRKKNPTERFFLYDVLNDYSIAKVDGKSDFSTLAHAERRGVKDNRGESVIWSPADMPPRTHKHYFGRNKHKELIYLISTHGLMKNPISKKKSRKKNPEVEVRELILFAENDYSLNNQFTAIIKNLERKHKRGIYDPVLAAKLWKYWIDNAVKEYNFQFGSGVRSLKQNIFTMKDRKDAAKAIEIQWREDIFRGDNPSRRKKSVKGKHADSNAYDGIGPHVVFLYDEKRISYIGRLKDGNFYIATKKADAYEMTSAKAAQIAQNIRKPKWAKSVGIHKAKFPMKFARAIQKITWGKV